MRKRSRMKRLQMRKRSRMQMLLRLLQSSASAPHVERKGHPRHPLQLAALQAQYPDARWRGGLAARCCTGRGNSRDRVSPVCIKLRDCRRGGCTHRLYR